MPRSIDSFLHCSVTLFVNLLNYYPVFVLCCSRYSFKSWIWNFSPCWVGSFPLGKGWLILSFFWPVFRGGLKWAWFYVCVDFFSFGFFLIVAVVYFFAHIVNNRITLGLGYTRWFLQQSFQREGSWCKFGVLHCLAFFSQMLQLFLGSYLFFFHE